MGMMTCALSLCELASCFLGVAGRASHIYYIADAGTDHDSNAGLTRLERLPVGRDVPSRWLLYFCQLHYRLMARRPWWRHASSGPLTAAFSRLAPAAKASYIPKCPGSICRGRLCSGPKEVSTAVAIVVAAAIRKPPSAQRSNWSDCAGSCVSSGWVRSSSEHAPSAGLATHARATMREQSYSAMVAPGAPSTVIPIAIAP